MCHPHRHEAHTIYPASIEMRKSLKTKSLVVDRALLANTLHTSQLTVTDTLQTEHLAVTNSQGSLEYSFPSAQEFTSAPVGSLLTVFVGPDGKKGLQFS